jgi:hypothetical protein
MVNCMSAIFAINHNLLDVNLANKVIKSAHRFVDTHLAKLRILHNANLPCEEKP